MKTNSHHTLGDAPVRPMGEPVNAEEVVELIEESDKVHFCDDCGTLTARRYVASNDDRVCQSCYADHGGDSG